MVKYTTKLSSSKKINKSSKGAIFKGSTRERRSPRNYAAKKWGYGRDSYSKGRRLRKLMSKKKVKKALQISLAAGFILLFFGIVFTLWYVQKISKDLPSPDEPFGAKDTASVIYDRNGNQLYKVYGNENRDPLELPDDTPITDVVPESVVWAFLSAEDINFYEHSGFDVTSMINCGIKNVAGTSTCGGSTITQQLVKQTVLTNERRLERKVKELLLSMQVERLYGKDQILAMYLTVAPMGSNVYGVNTGSRFYFGKDLKDLSLAEAAILASIPQNPSILSPTLSTDPDGAEEKLKARQNYVLDQMLKYKDKINKEVDDDEFITEDKINEAREQELVYVEPRIDIKAPHFVFYVQQVLQERNYNNGIPFTLAEIETGGYKITTTLDYDLQETAEKYLKENGVGIYGAKYGAKNAALATIRPSTGEVLAYVGSKDYNAESEGKLFDPKVDILTSLQQPGSSAKPITYYNAFNTAVASPGTDIPDIPIKIGNYEPKNSDGTFSGMNTARYHLVNSKNIPAIILVEATGVSKYIETAKNFGYTTFTDPSNYGPSITLGAADVEPIEHAQAFGVLANGGNYVQHEVILKIEDKNGDIVYEHKPELKKVADAQATYLVNDVLKGVPKAWPTFTGDGRDVAAKTGTSEENRDTWYVMYSPEFVTVGWLGNNDNTRMAGNAFGSTSVKPWVQSYMQAILGYFPEKKSFSRPSGISTKQVCTGSGDSKICSGSSDLVIDGREPPVYMSKKTVRVCDDQQANLAREIDESTGHAIDKEFIIYKMPAESLQSFADQKFSTLPDSYCTIDRSPQGNPWATFTNPSSGATYASTLPVAFNAFSPNANVTRVDMYIDSSKVGSTTTLPYSNSFDISGLSAGSHSFRAVVYDAAGKSGESSISFNISNGAYTITSPSGSTVTSPVTVTASFSGAGSPSGVKLCIDGSCTISMSGSGTGPYTATWSPSAGTYTIHVQDNNGSTSPAKNITVL